MMNYVIDKETLDDMLAFENRTLADQEIVTLFNNLYKTGIIYRLNKRWTVWFNKFCEIGYINLDISPDLEA